MDILIDGGNSYYIDDIRRVVKSWLPKEVQLRRCRNQREAVCNLERGY